MKFFKNGTTFRCCREQEFLDLKSVLKNPKLELNTLEIESEVDNRNVFHGSRDAVYRDVFDGIRDSMNINVLKILEDAVNRNVFDDLEDAVNFTHSLNVRNLILKEYSLDKHLNIIPSLKPGYLTTINIVSRDPNVDSMEKVFEMEQWKQAKYFKMDEACFIWPLRNLFHFKKFTVTIRRLSVEDVRQMKEVRL